MQYRDINTIKPDPKQPRKIFDESHISGLAQSITQEGLINPIEIDDTGMIITGECRWRASKQLGLTKVPVNVNSSGYGEYERLRHQMAENVHQSGSSYDTMMNPIDVANGYAKLLELRGKWLPGKQSQGKDAGIRELAREIGIDHATVSEYLSLLDQPKYLQKAVSDGLPRTYIREADKAPEELRDTIKKKMAKGEYNSRDEISREVAIGHKLPDLAIIDLERKQAKESIETNRILNGVSRLALALEGQPLSEIDVREKGIIIKQLEWLAEKITNYLEE